MCCGRIKHDVVLTKVYFNESSIETSAKLTRIKVTESAEKLDSLYDQFSSTAKINPSKAQSTSSLDFSLLNFDNISNSPACLSAEAMAHFNMENPLDFNAAGTNTVDTLDLPFPDLDPNQEESLDLHQFLDIDVGAEHVDTENNLFPELAAPASEDGNHVEIDECNLMKQSEQWEQKVQQQVSKVKVEQQPSASGSYFTDSFSQDLEKLLTGGYEVKTPKTPERAPTPPPPPKSPVLPTRSQRGRPRSTTSYKPETSSRRRQVPKNSAEYKERRERNNVAVRKSREKSRQKQRSTEAKVEELTEENRQLTERAAYLETELNTLKNLFKSVVANRGFKEPEDPDLARMSLHYLNN